MNPEIDITETISLKQFPLPPIFRPRPSAIFWSIDEILKIDISAQTNPINRALPLKIEKAVGKIATGAFARVILSINAGTKTMLPKNRRQI